ncbi:hypothetical protein FRC06_006735 [Ceratobasidium sp. 370]|nr:hypothetical protein FRC06_006735 [Ceratobasidium sp. 370]
MKNILALALGLSAPLVALAAIPLYGQCGGLNYSGDTTCVDGAYCQYQNDYYWQCLAGTATTTATSTKTTSTSATQTPAVTTITKATTTSTSAGTMPSSGTVPLDKMYGYATLNGGTTGGAGGSSTTVTSLSALRAAVSGDSAKDLTSGKDYYDGCLDITHAGDYVTVSWNYFHNHWKTSLIGHSDSNESEDTGKLRVTYHHNWFLNVGSRLPSLRFGTGHVYNQLMDTASESGINSRVGARMLIEYCQFINIDKPVLT